MANYSLLFNKCKKLLLYVIILSIAFCNSCNEGTAPEMLSKAPYDINVNGRITSDFAYQYIKLSKPILTGEAKYTKAGDYTYFVSEIIEEPVEDAVVSISDGANIFELKLFNDTGYWAGKDKGVYRTINKIAGIPGNVYTLHINYKGKNYFASDSMVAANDFSVIDETKKFKVSFDGRDNDYSYINTEKLKQTFNVDQPHYMLLEQGLQEMDFSLFYYELSFIRNSLNHEFTYSFPVISMSNALNSHPVTVQKTIDFNHLNTIYFMKHSMSQKYFEFMYAYFSELEWRNSLFTAVPGKIPTNLSEGGVGFFHATDVKRKSISGKEFTDLILKNN